MIIYNVELALWEFLDEINYTSKFATITNGVWSDPVPTKVMSDETLLLNEMIYVDEQGNKMEARVCFDANGRIYCKNPGIPVKLCHDRVFLSGAKTVIDYLKWEAKSKDVPESKVYELIGFVGVMYPEMFERLLVDMRYEAEVSIFSLSLNEAKRLREELNYAVEVVINGHSHNRVPPIFSNRNRGGSK